MEFIIEAWGHPLIKATHRTTFEITKDNYLTPRGDCIIGIKSSYSVYDLPEDLKHYLKEGKTIKIVLESEGIKDIIFARGDSKLLLTNTNSIVVRKSTFIDDRTLAIKATKAARDINRDLIKNLQKGKRLIVRIIYGL